MYVYWINGRMRVLRETDRRHRCWDRPRSLPLLLCFLPKWLGNEHWYLSVLDTSRQVITIMMIKIMITITEEIRDRDVDLV
jgi:uncharacterized membrane protein YhaH (DUF805 family)